MPLYQLMGRTPVERVLARTVAYRPAYLGDAASVAQQLITEAEAILVVYCGKAGASATQCAQFQTQFNICAGQFTAAVTTNDIVGLIAAGLCLSDLKGKIDDAIKKIPAPAPTPTPTPALPPSTGMPTWGWVLIGIGGVAVVGTIVAVVARK